MVRPLPAKALACALSLILPLVLGVEPQDPRPRVDERAREAPTAASLQVGRFGSGPIHKVFLEGEERFGRLAELRQSGAVRAEFDYGSFAVALVDERSFGGREELRRSSWPVRDEHDLLIFNGYVLDGARPETTLRQLDPAERSGGPRGEELDPLAGLYVLQFAAPVRDDWLEELEPLGIDFRQSQPMNGLVVGVPPQSVPALRALARDRAHVQYVGAYQPAFRMTPAVRALARDGAGQGVALTVQMIAGRTTRADLEELRDLSLEPLRSTVVGPYRNVHLVLDPIYLRYLAAKSNVFGIELGGFATRNDERQGQIVANQVSGGTVAGPGYLAWLATKGFNSSQFSGFSVNVVDDALSLTGHPDLPGGRVAFTQNPTNQTGAEGGHGFLNAHIVAGFNDSSASALNDAGGFNYGLGIAPWAQVGTTAIFGLTGASASSWESSAYQSGARISTNSWGFETQFGDPVPDYNSAAQEYDFLVRDARSTQGGNQEYTVVFSAGNDGPGTNTVSSPGTAKNIITVGAAENDRQTGTDGCGVPNSGANDWRDVIDFSSRGPVDLGGGDGRWKPEIQAPGTHIQAGVPQSNYAGTSVCNAFWPSGQTLYGWSSGTSHSCPAVAGGATLVRQWFENQALGTPSPAMVKAVLVGTSQYMTGVGANDTLPSNSQGMGSMNLDLAFGDAERLLVDQSATLSTTGADFTLVGTVDDPAEPFRVALVWTDAPGSTTGAPWVNDLDLTVDVGGQVYRGNVFSGATSTTGGSHDLRNNSEFVFLPPGTSGAFVITVDASSISGDGIPGNGDGTDQDFALFVYNGTTSGGGVTAQFTGSPISGEAPLNVSFTDFSTGGVDTWSWDFGDGGSSGAQHPSHTYNTPGTYTVSLTASGPGGSDDEVKADYIVVNAPPPPGINDGSFELQTASSAPGAPWTVFFGSGHVISPSGVSTDNGMPSDGSQWAELAADSTNGSTPPSNPGGVTAPPVGGAGISQDFNYPAGQTTFTFDAAFMRNENANEATYNDWMSVDLSDGSTTVNVYYRDTFSPTPNTSTKFGFAMTAVETINVDLAALFPSSTPATEFTLTAQVGNAVDDFQPSKGYVDNFVFLGAPAAPVAEFSGTPTSGVAPLLVNFTDLSTGTVTSWSWSFGDGGSSTAQNPSHTYNTPGTYTVTLTATGPGGSDGETKANYVVVDDPPPVAEFSGIPTTGVAPLLVSFSDLSTGAVTSWSWSFGDGGSSTSQNPGHTYNTPGTYTVTLTATGPGGSDGETKANYIVVDDPPPVAEFSGTPTTGVAPLLVNFSDLSAGAVTSWSWSFGDGGSSTSQNPGHTYNTPGTYTVTLTATGPGGSDGETKANYIVVDDPPPVAEFSGTPTTGVAPLLVNFSDLSTGAVTSWSWSFGDGGSSTAQNPSHTYNTPGTYAVTLTATGPGGSDGETKTGYIVVDDPPPVAEFSGTPTTGVAPLLVNFSDLSTGAVTSWSWSFGDGGSSTAQNPSHTYNTPGTYVVALTATGPGGSDGETKVGYIVVDDPPPVAEFSGTPTTGVAPLLVNFSDLSTGAVTSWSWSFGDGGSSTSQNPSHTYNTPGTYAVTLTATGPGGSDGETKTGYIVVDDPPPVADFSGTPTTGVAPLLVSFSDLSTGAVTSWSWSFGDGGSSTAQNPSHTYNTPGTYAVTLTATGPGGSDGETKTGYIVVDDPPPVAEFSGTPTTGVAPLLVNFSDLSTGAVTSWSWSFGDGGSSTSQNPSHTYNTPGTYAVTLTATGPGGSDGETKTGYIVVDDPPPVAEFSGTPTTGVAPLLVNFSDLSTGAVTSWSWSFGDGGSSTAQNPSHTYNTPGTYAVTLTATGPGGSDGETKTGYIVVDDPPPVAEFSGTPTTGVAPLLVNFSDLSTGAVTSWSWSFGDGGSSTAQNPSHTYNTPGTYAVTLTATGPGGSDGETKTGYIVVDDPPPVAEFSGTPTTGVAPLLVNFSDLSTGAVTSWSWSFGDGGSSTAQNPSHTYNTPGTYAVTLTATGPGGSDGETKVGYIVVDDPPPVAEFSGTPTTGVAPLLVNFSDLSTGAVTSWSWNFGDGGSSTVQNPSHTYNTPGTYAVTLTATGPGGFDGETKTGYIVVDDPPPVAEFSGTPTTGVAPLLVNFSDLSTGAVTSWSWSFGDGGSSTAQNPSHTYNTPGTYAVTLTATGPGGSNGETKAGYIVVDDPPPVAEFFATPTSGTSPLLVDFSDLSTGAVTSWSWSFGDGGSSTAQNPSHTYNTPGTYTVTLTVTGPGGSDDEVKADLIAVSPPPPPAIGSITPSTLEAVQVGSAQTVVIDGTDFLPSSTVSVDGTPLDPSDFTVVSDTQITLAWPLVDQLGATDVVVSNANGSDTSQVTVTDHASPVLSMTETAIDQAVGIELAIGTQFGDIAFVMLSPDLLPTSFPGAFDLAIGNNDTSLFLLWDPVIFAKSWKQRLFGPLSGLPIGTELHFQAAVASFADNYAFPWDVSNVQSATIAQ